MPLADRNPLAAAEARICALELQLAQTKRDDQATVERDRKYW